MRLEMMPDLISFGMTEREAKLYLAMMGKAEWKSGDLYRMTGIPRAQVHQTLELMVSRHYCLKRREGRFSYYRAIPPAQLKENLLHKWEEEMATNVQRSHSTLDALAAEFKTVEQKDRPLDFVEVVQTPHRIHQRYLESFLEVKEEVLALNRSPYSFLAGQPSPRIEKQQNEANRRAAEKGVTIKDVIMYEEDPFNHLIKVFSEFSEKKIVNIRIIDFLPMKMTLLDRKIVYLSVKSPADPLGNEMNDIIIHDESIAAGCVDLFFHYWELSLPYTEWLKKHNDTIK